MSLDIILNMNMYSFNKTLSVPKIPLDSYYKDNYYYWHNCANEIDIKSIIELGESLEQSSAKIGSYDNSVLSDKVRVSNISWIYHNDQSKFFFDFMIDKIDRINYHHYGMSLFGMESIQYTRYPIGGHYQFHNDIIVSKDKMRKLSIVLALTDKNEYEGGEFLLMPHGQNPERFRFNRGDLIGFPSWIPHKVEPVIAGTRITAVTWAYGPYFV